MLTSIKLFNVLPSEFLSGSMSSLLLSCHWLQVVTESLNPVWNQTFDFVVEDGLHDMLMLEVYDHDTFSRVSSVEVFIVMFSE